MLAFIYSATFEAGPPHVALADLALQNLSTSAFQVLGFKACTTTSSHLLQLLFYGAKDGTIPGVKARARRSFVNDAMKLDSGLSLAVLLAK